MSGPSSEAMKLTSPERNEVLQLIAGVRRTAGGGMEQADYLKVDSTRVSFGDYWRWKPGLPFLWRSGSFFVGACRQRCWCRRFRGYSESTRLTLLLV